jgi:hypothetical protein
MAAAVALAVTRFSAAAVFSSGVVARSTAAAARTLITIASVYFARISDPFILFGVAESFQLFLELQTQQQQPVTFFCSQKKITGFIRFRKKDINSIGVVAV